MNGAHDRSANRKTAEPAQNAGAGFTGALIEAVEPGSLGEEIGLSPGDRILAIDGCRITDVIEYKYRLATEDCTLHVLKANGEQWEVELEKEYDEDLGVSFGAAVFDRIRRCANHCIFCFVDQMPEGLRRSLYVKDDDYRLSFWDGNFITLTNLTEDDLRRIEDERLSPLYISVHTTNPDLRRHMMANPRAGEVLPLLRRLAASRIEMHLQLVLCPGINDGPELWRTVHDLEGLMPYVRSIAAVPVGLTAFRDGLTALRRYTAPESAAVVEEIESRQARFLKKYNTRLLFASDEFYLVGGKPMPPAEAYENFPQLENGVGLVRRFRDGYEAAVLNRSKKGGRPIPHADRIWTVTGVLGAAALAPLLPDAATVVIVQNDFFGPMVTATGLLTARDIVKALAAKVKSERRSEKSPAIPRRILIPDIIFRSGRDVTIDERRKEDLVHDIARETGLEPGIVSIVATEPETLAEAYFGEVRNS